MRQMPKATAQKTDKESYWQAIINTDDLPRADRIIGQRTLSAVKAMNQIDIILKFNVERLEFYANLNTFLAFGWGWTRQLASNLRFSAEHH